MIHRILFFYIAIMMLSACGYQWGNRGSEVLPGKYREIAVPMFKNKTQEVGSEVYFTNAIIEEIARSPNAITSSDKAEIVLEGELSRVEVTGEGLANVTTLPALVELVSSYKLLVEVHIRVRKKSDQTLLFSERFTGERTYASAQIGNSKFNSANPNYNQSALHENLKIISVDLMAKAYNLMTESY